jgi:hypothetical protein
MTVKRLKPKQAQKLTSKLGEIFAIEDSCTSDDPDASPMEKLAVTFVKELLAFDRERAIPVINDWRYWLENADTKKVEDFDTIDEYIPYRIVNVGISYVSLNQLVISCMEGFHELIILIGHVFQ